MNTSIANQGGSDHPPIGPGMATTAVGTDNLTSQIAGMSKHQLYQIVSQMKDLIQQNQQQARQILIANPQLTKTLFQAQIMLGMVRAPDTLPPAVLTPAQPSTGPAQPPQHSPAPTPALQVPPTPSPPSVVPYQPLSSPQPAPQQPPPQIASPYLQQSQAAIASPQASQPSFQYQQSVQSPSHALTAATLQPTMQPPLPTHPPPLPQQPRPSAPSPQIQQQTTQGIGFTSSSVPQSYHPQPPYMQQVVQSPQNNASASFQQIHVPPLPSQPPQHMFQVSRDMGANANIGSGAMLAVGGAVESGRGLNMGVASTSASPMSWNQSLPSAGAISVPQVTPAGHMVPGQHPFVGGVALTASMVSGPGSNSSQPFNQSLTQLPPQQQPQPQPQMAIELEQQKALLQQVMNLTPEQINLLPLEQRQQVLQLQQAFRSQSG